MTILLNARTTGSSQPDERGLIDCSLHPSIKNKPAHFLQEFSRGWQQNRLSLQALRQHVSSGGAFIPAAMKSDKRSSGAFLHADIAVVDIDGGLLIEDFRQHWLAAHAAWIYTTCSHQPGSGSDRFRIVFRLQERITNPDRYTHLLSALSSELAGDRSCTDPCRLFYGNSAALHPLFSPENTLSSATIGELCNRYPRHNTPERPTAESLDAITIDQAIYVLENVLEPTADGERDRFIKITAAACSGGEALLAPWQNWASRCHHTSGHRAKQGSERFFHSFRNTRSSINTLFYFANEQDPHWRASLPAELRSGGFSLAPTHKAAGYDFEDFLHGGLDNPAFGEEDYEQRENNATTPSVFEISSNWAVAPQPAGQQQSTDPPEPAATADEASIDDPDQPPAHHFEDDEDPDPGDDFEDDPDCYFEDSCEDIGTAPSDGNPLANASNRARSQRERNASEQTEVTQILEVLRRHFPGIRLNVLTQRYEYNSGGVIKEFDDITCLYIELAPYLGKIPPKTAVTDMAKVIARKNSYHPASEYLKHCADHVAPWPEFGKLATTILGLADDPIQNPILAHGRALGDVVMERFLIAAVARVFDPGCSHQWMPILVGDQAIGKSRFIELLTPESPAGSGKHPWTAFSQVPLTSLAEHPHKLHCGWIVVLDETERHFRRDQVEILKNLVSTSIDYDALKYEQYRDFPRSFVLIGATNTDTFLKDPTGNRRFLPIYVKGKPKPDSTTGERSVDLQCLIEHRDAIWSAAVHAYRKAKAAGEQPWHFFSDELAEIKSYMEGFFSDNPYMSKLSELTRFNISQSGIETHDGKKYVKLHTIFDYLDVAIDRHNSATIPVSDALRRLGYTNKRIRIGKKQIRAWFFPEDQQPRDSAPPHRDAMPAEW